MNNVHKIRKTVLPQELYDVVEKFMLGELVSLQITALTSDRKVKDYSFGVTPKALAKVAGNKPCEIVDFIANAKR